MGEREHLHLLVSPFLCPGLCVTCRSSTLDLTDLQGMFQVASTASRSSAVITADTWTALAVSYRAKQYAVTKNFFFVDK